MATRIVLATPPAQGDGHDGIANMSVLVAEDFDTVLDRVFPLNPATSSLEHRNNILFTRPDGRRVIVQTQACVRIDEEADEEE